MKILKNPWIILLAIVGGILVGLLVDEQVVAIIAPMGDLYIQLLQMSIVPIVVTAIISSIAQLVRSPVERKRVVWSLTQMFFLSMVFFSGLSLLVGLLVKPGVLTERQQHLVGQVIEASPYETDYGIALNTNKQPDNVAAPARKNNLVKFFTEFVPSNVFSALASGEILQLVFFCFLFGIATAFIETVQSNYIVSFMTSMFLAFQKIIEWVMYPLPFGLFAIVANQVATTGITPLLALVKFILSFYFIGVMVLIINTLLISRKAQLGVFNTFRKMLNPIIISLSTRSSVATIPASLQVLSEDFGFDRIVTKLVLPLGITIARYGNVIFFSLAGIYVAQVYDMGITIVQLLIICFSAILAGIATSGATGFATLGMLSIVLEFLGLPAEAIIIVFFAVDPIIDPMRTLLIVHCNIMLTSMVLPHNRFQRSPQQSGEGVATKGMKVQGERV